LKDRLQSACGGADGYERELRAVLLHSWRLPGSCLFLGRLPVGFEDFPMKIIYTSQFVV
jgi:hypothetical protein